jgi:hypothetical protein
MRLSTTFRRALLAVLISALAAAGALVSLARNDHESCAGDAARAAAPADPDARAMRCAQNVPENETEDLMQISAQRTAVAAAPGARVPAGAYAAGARAAAARAKDRRELPEDARTWTAVGKGPLHSDVDGYTGVNGLGLDDLSGRPTDFAYDAKDHRLLASIAYGGVWASGDLGKTWTSIGDGLPTQVVGSVGFIPQDAQHRKGTIVAITGDGSFGADSLEGMGAFRSTDGGRSWQRASGVPDGAFGFRVAVDQAHPGTVYAATGAGLFRSTDFAKTFQDVKLPVGDCAGKGNVSKACSLANIVSDVVVQAPGGAADATGGAVLAAVGWRGGAQKNPDGTVQSPGNGLYRSDDGASGSFTKIDAPGFAPQNRIGRIQLGEATGPAQDHNYVYAMVQDAVLQNKGVTGLDVDTGTEKTVAAKVPTVFRGVYASPDFGKTWVESTDAAALQSPTTGSSLAVVFQATGAYGPGVQSWYNEWISPDPLHQAGGVPTQLLFGLEEVWRNESTNVPQAGPSAFRVVGRYFSGNTCLGLQQSPCPTNREDALKETSTTHPDQHAAIWVPDAGGQGATLVVGNDGGVYTQHIGSGHPNVDNDSWGKGSQGSYDAATGVDHSLHTLLPYDAAMAKDGTVWMGLQDNGSGKITPDGQQIEGLGGDGFFVGVDPDNSGHAYAEYTYGAMSATTDGGKSWTGMSPPITNGQFSNPFAVDPQAADHVLTAGRQVVETGSGTGTGADDWSKVFDLGTVAHPADANATATADDPANSMTAIALNGANGYVGFCGVCDVLNQKLPFHNGIATNVAGAAPPKRYSTDGWHIAKAKGLPNRYITSVAMDPTDPNTVWVSLGGYSRPWTHVHGGNAAGGHLYVSHDAGQTFTDMSGDATKGGLPDIIANWVMLRDGRALVATDIGVFAQIPGTQRFELLGKGLPAVRVATLRPDPADANEIVAATYGRGVYAYRFSDTVSPPVTTPPPTLNPAPFSGANVAGPFGFETDDQGWVIKGTQTMTWRRGSPGHASTSSEQVLPYTDAASTSLTSPKFTLPNDSNVKVSWWDMRRTEDCCDFMAVDWSNDGHVWHNVWAQAGENKDYPDFSQQSAQFVAPQGDLYVRFRLTADQLVSAPAYPGVAVDDIQVQR